MFGFANADVLVDAIAEDVRRKSDRDVTASEAGAGGLQGKNSRTVHDQPNCMSAATLLKMVRASAQSLRAPDVATLLLLAQDLQNSRISLGRTLSVLSDPRPIITVLCEMPGFEESFLELLKRGVILPGKVSISDGYDIHGRRGFHFTNVPEAKWQVICFAGKQHVSGNLNAKIGEAAQTVFPILGLSERPDRLPPRLVAAAQLNVDCGLLNADIVGQTVEAVLGTVPNTSLAKRTIRYLISRIWRSRSGRGLPRRARWQSSSALPRKDAKRSPTALAKTMMRWGSLRTGRAAL